jgi:hypothetical protein
MRNLPRPIPIVKFNHVGAPHKEVTVRKVLNCPVPGNSVDLEDQNVEPTSPGLEAASHVKTMGRIHPDTCLSALSVPGTVAEVTTTVLFCQKSEDRIREDVAQRMAANAS